MACSLCYFVCYFKNGYDIYYQPNHLWKGQKPIKKLQELSGEKPKTVKQWLFRQAFWQVHLQAPAHIYRP